MVDGAYKLYHARVIFVDPVVKVSETHLASFTTADVCHNIRSLWQFIFQQGCEWFSVQGAPVFGVNLPANVTVR